MFLDDLRGIPGVLGSLLLSRSNQGRYQFSPKIDLLFNVLAAVASAEAPIECNEGMPPDLPGREEGRLRIEAPSRTTRDHISAKDRSSWDYATAPLVSTQSALDKIA